MEETYSVEEYDALLTENKGLRERLALELARRYDGWIWLAVLLLISGVYLMDNSYGLDDAPVMARMK